MQTSVRSIAALYDIHGNAPALEAVLAAVSNAGIEHVVIGGDIALGPLPRETLTLIQTLGTRAHVIRGNCDRLVAASSDSGDLATLPRGVRETIDWTAAVLTDAERAYLRTLPLAWSVDVAGVGRVTFCHATMRRDDEIVTVRTSDDALLDLFAGTEAEVVVCGHTHMQFDRSVRGLRVVNAGSVGMPYGEPGAHWATIGPAVQLRHTRYDLVAAATRLRASAYPGAAVFAESHVLRPPTARDMLQLFSPE